MPYTKVVGGGRTAEALLFVVSIRFVMIKLSESKNISTKTNFIELPKDEGSKYM